MCHATFPVSLPMGGSNKEQRMITHNGHVLWERSDRDQRRAYMRWGDVDVAERPIDVRLTLKLTKRRKLTWRTERRQMRQMLRWGGA